MTTPATTWRVFAPRTDVFVLVTSLTAYDAKHVASVLFATLADAHFSVQDFTRVEALP